MDNLIAVALGLGIRAVIDSVAHESYQASAIVGIWEGVVLNHFLTKFPNSVDPYVAFGFRLFIDYLYTHSMFRQFVILLWTGLGMLLSNVALDMSADRRFRRLWRRFFPRSRSSRVRFHSTSSAGSRRTSARLPSPPPPPVRPATRPVPGQFDQYSEITQATFLAGSSSPSETGSDIIKSSHLVDSPRTSTSLEYGPLPDISDAHASVDFDPRRQTLPPNTGERYNIDDKDAPSIHSGLTTPIDGPQPLSRALDDEDRPRVHSGLTTPENLPLNMQTTPGLPPINVYDASDKPIADSPEQAGVPIRLMLANPSPDVAEPPVTFPDPEIQARDTLIPTTSEIPNIPTPLDPPPSFAEAMKGDQRDADADSLFGRESIITATGGKDAIIAKADAMREKAQQQEDERARTIAEIKKARSEKRFFDVLRLELEREEIDHKISLLHAKAARRYFRGTDILSRLALPQYLTTGI